MTLSGVIQYKWLSSVAIGLLTIDLFFNVAFLLFSHHTLIMLLLYIIQDVCLVFSLILLFLVLFSTTRSQAGLIGEVVYKFRWCILVAVSYLALSLGFHSWSLREQWEMPDAYIWTHGMVALFTVQRIVSGFHYHLYKRTILRLSDSYFYVKLLYGRGS